MTQFDPPLYNIWKQKDKDHESSYFGTGPLQWIDNLLYMYTKPFDIVVDPFAGGGPMIDICQKRSRRYYVSDRKPVSGREHEIRQYDLTDGLPKVPHWKDVKLVYLDPPYWKQAEGMYSTDPTDLANMDLDQFHDTLENIIKGFAGKLSDAYIALIIQPTQWKAPERQFTHHMAEMIRRVKSEIDLCLSVPYEASQYTPQMVNWAKENRTVLVLTREIIVWKVA